MAKTFLDLVNGVVDETKVTLDHLTSSNFASPPRTTMYNRFKSWVNMAYRELLIDRPEWKFRAASGIVDIWPRLKIAGIAPTYTPAVGDSLIGTISGVEFTVEAVHYFDSEIVGDISEATLSVTPIADNELRNLVLDEPLDLTDPTLSLGVAVYSGPGAYNFPNIKANIDEIHDSTVRVSLTADDANASSDTNTYPVDPIPWPEWSYFQTIPWGGDRPRYMSQDDAGNWHLWPQPSGHQLLTLNYTRTFADLVNWNDTAANLPDKYQDYLIWRAVQEYADFDGQQKLFSRASKHVDKYLAWLARDQLRQVGLVGWANRRR